MKKTENVPKRQSKKPQVTLEHLAEITNILKQHNDIILELRTDNALIKQSLYILSKTIFPDVPIPTEQPN